MKELERPQYKWKPEKLGGKRLTMPGLYVKPYEALQAFRDKSFEEKAANYYADEGAPIPNFEMMDKIERLEALGEYQDIVRQQKADLQKRNDEIKAAKEKDELNKFIENELSTRLKQQTANPGGNPG